MLVAASLFFFGVRRSTSVDLYICTRLGVPFSRSQMAKKKTTTELNPIQVALDELVLKKVREASPLATRSEIIWSFKTRSGWIFHPSAVGKSVERLANSGQIACQAFGDDVILSVNGGSRGAA